MYLLQFVGVICFALCINSLPNLVPPPQPAEEVKVDEVKVETVKLEGVGPVKEHLSTVPSEKDMYWGLEKPQEEYKLPELPYAYDALEPYIDAATMEIHYSAIFKEYTVKLNNLLKKWRASKDKTAADLAKTSIINMWRNLDKIPKDFKKEFSYYAGGYMNHLLYFSTLSPNPNGEERNASKEMIENIERSFHNVTQMKADLNETARNLFGTGWVYIVRAIGYADGEYLTVMSTLEEMTPMDNKRIFPILALDVWEHAYFKKYANRRAEYINNWWKIVDWVKVERILNWWKIQVPEVIIVKHTDL